MGRVLSVESGTTVSVRPSRSPITTTLVHYLQPGDALPPRDIIQLCAPSGSRRLHRQCSVEPTRQRSHKMSRRTPMRTCQGMPLQVLSPGGAFKQGWFTAREGHAGSMSHPSRQARWEPPDGRIGSPARWCRPFLYSKVPGEPSGDLWRPRGSPWRPRRVTTAERSHVSKSSVAGREGALKGV